MYNILINDLLVLYLKFQLKLNSAKYFPIFHLICKELLFFNFNLQNRNIPDIEILIISLLINEELIKNLMNIVVILL